MVLVPSESINFQGLWLGGPTAETVPPVDEVLRDALSTTDPYCNNRVEVDHGRLKARLKVMGGLRRDRTAAVVIRGHSFVQSVRGGHYELGEGARGPQLRLAAAFEELVDVI